MTDLGDLLRLSADLGKASADVTRKGQRVVTATAALVERTAKLLAPVDTGALRNSIGTTVSNGGLTAEIGPTVDYAAYVEFGTRRMAPQPHMGPALAANADTFVRAVEELGGEVLS